MCDSCGIPVLRSKNTAGSLLSWEHCEFAAMGSKQLALRPISTKRGGEGSGVDGKAAAVACRERSSLANASFRVYYSLRAGAVPFLWESAPGTPRSGGGGATAPSQTVVPPPISPPPSYQSSQLKGTRGCRPRSSCPATAGGIVSALLGMIGLRKGHHRSRRRRTARHL